MIKVLLKKSRLSVALLGAIAAGAIVNAGSAKAVLVYELIEQGGDVQVRLSGSLSGLPAGLSPAGYGFSGFQPSAGMISFGSFSGTSYGISGPSSFGSGGAVTITGVTSGAIQVGLVSVFTPSDSLWLSSSYVQGDPLTASGLITGKTLSTLGLSSTSGLVASWTVGSDSIELWAGAKPAASPAAAPGPLPLLGAGAAFGYSRRLRSRLRGGRPSLKA